MPRPCFRVPAIKKAALHPTMGQKLHSCDTTQINACAFTRLCVPSYASRLITGGLPSAYTEASARSCRPLKAIHFTPTAAIAPPAALLTPVPQSYYSSSTVYSYELVLDNTIFFRIVNPLFSFSPLRLPPSAPALRRPACPPSPLYGPGTCRLEASPLFPDIQKRPSHSMIRLREAVKNLCFLCRKMSRGAAREGSEAAARL